jgi:hypothetical protein
MPLCEHCGKEFTPDPRLGNRQRACRRKKCQKARHAANCREWRETHPTSKETAAAKARSFRESHPDAQRDRRDRPGVWKRELEQQRRRRQLARGLRETGEGDRDSLIVQVADLKALALGLVPGSEGDRDSIPSEVLARIGRARGEPQGDEGECDSMDPSIAVWESRGRRVLERLAFSRRRRRA